MGSVPGNDGLDSTRCQTREKLTFVTVVMLAGIERRLAEPPPRSPDGID